MKKTLLKLTVPALAALVVLALAGSGCSNPSNGGGGDGLMVDAVVWKLTGGAVTQTITITRGYAMPEALVESGGKLYVAGFEYTDIENEIGNVKVWELTNGTVTKTITLAANIGDTFISGIVESGGYLYVAGFQYYTGVAKMWKVPVTGGTPTTIPFPAGSSRIEALVKSGGTLYAAGSGNYTDVVWKIVNDVVTKTITLPYGPAEALVESGGSLYAAGFGGVWKIVGDTVTETISIPNGYVQSLVASGGNLYAGGSDHSILDYDTLTIWKIAGNTVTQTIPLATGTIGYRYYVDALAESGGTLYAAGVKYIEHAESTYFIWKVATTGGAVTEIPLGGYSYANALIESGGSIYAAGVKY